MKLMAALTITLLAQPAPAEILDRIAVTVGKHVIAESEIVRDLRIAAFIDAKTPDLSGPSKRAAAARLVDQYLVLEDAAQTRAPVPSMAEVDSLAQPFEDRYASQDEYHSALRNARITETELREHLAAGLRMLRYTELRFGPEAQFSEEDLRQFQASLARGGTAIPDLEQDRNELTKLFTDQRVMQALDRWLEETRHTSPVVYREAAFQ